jgi:hypothetical protein
VKLTALDTIELWIKLMRGDLIEVIRHGMCCCLPEEERRANRERRACVRRRACDRGPKTLVVNRGSRARWFGAMALFAAPAIRWCMTDRSW